MAKAVSAGPDRRRLGAIGIRAAVVAIAACMSASGACADRPPRPTVEDFFGSALVRDVKLSPNGDFLAMTALAPNGRVRLLVADLTKPIELHPLASFSGADVRRFFWVNNRRLAYDGQDLRSGEETGYGGLFAVDRDGSDAVQLIAATFDFHQEITGSQIRSRILPTTHVFASTVPGETDDVIVAELVSKPSDRSLDHLRLIRLNTRSREQHSLLDRQPPWVQHWLLDADGDPRIAVSWHEGIQRVHHRGKGSPDWKLLDEKNEFDPQAMDPRFIDMDDGLYVARGDALYRVDLKQPTQAEKPFLTLNGFDFNGSWEVDQKERKLLGVHFLTDAHGTRWIDPRMGETQKTIDAAMPATINTVTCTSCLSSRFLLVHAESDRQPARFFLFDPAAHKFIGGVGDARPRIDAKQMGQRDFFRYRARDGLEIPVYVTLPPGRKKDERVPLVVLVHGGPWVRGGSWEWDAEAQFLATRGYAVIQPEFRGSIGFGYDHFHAGWHQWGLAMQDDLTDAARWAVAQGYADPVRIAIGGASYGGYATLMGLIKDPEVFRCGFELAGVTDIGLMYSIVWSDASDEALKYGMPTLIADPEKDAAQIAETSPLKSAQRLTQPLLMAYGANDVRVPITHGTKFRDAVAHTNRNVEWHVYNGEGHGLRQDEHRIDYWRHVEAFLDRCFSASPNQVSDNRPGPAPGTGASPSAPQ